MSAAVGGTVIASSRRPQSRLWTTVGKSHLLAASWYDSVIDTLGFDRVVKAIGHRHLLTAFRHDRIVDALRLDGVIDASGLRDGQLAPPGRGERIIDPAPLGNRVMKAVGQRDLNTHLRVG